MYFQYMASNAPFRDQEDTNLISVRMRDAEALGYKLPDWCTPDFYTHEHNKNQRIWLKKDENNNATFRVRSFEYDDFDMFKSDKPYFASLRWIDSEEKAEALIQYVKEHLATTDEVELCFLYQGPIYTEEEIGCRIVNINELQAAEVKTFFDDYPNDDPRRMIIRK